MEMSKKYFESVVKLKYLIMATGLVNKNNIHKEVKVRLN
jgi:hypothetical protein